MTDYFQMASDEDGELHLFPHNLAEPDYLNRWRVWVIDEHGESFPAPICDPLMCVNDGVVSNPLGRTGHEMLKGWWVDQLGATGIELAIDNGDRLRFPHPRHRT